MCELGGLCVAAQMSKLHTFVSAHNVEPEYGASSKTRVGCCPFDSFVSCCVVFCVGLCQLDPNAGNPASFCVHVPTDENERFGSVGQDQASIHVGCKVLSLLFLRLDNEQTFQLPNQGQSFLQNHAARDFFCVASMQRHLDSSASTSLHI